MANWISTDEPLFFLVSAGRETHPASAAYLHDCTRRTPPLRAVLQLTLAGAGFHQRGGRRSVLTPGMAFLDLLPGEWSYGYASESRGPYEQVFVGFTGEAALALARQIIGRFGNVLSFGADSPLVAPMMTLARQHMRCGQVDRYQTSARIYELGMLMLSLLGRQRSTTCPVAAGALRLIEQQACDPGFNVAALASALGCSRSHLTRRFLAATAASPLEYLLQVRLELARKALRAGNARIKDLAVQHGFAGANYFCRVFQQRYRMTPLAYRHSSRG